MADKTASFVRAWIVVLVASLFFFFVYVQATLFNSISSYLLKEFHLTAGQLGQLSSCYFIMNVILLFPAGILLDRFSPYKIILFSMSIGILGTLLFSFATSFAMLVFSRILIGVFGASCFLSCIKIASRWFPPQRMALVSGVIVTMAMLGGIAAQTPFVLLTQHIGWRDALRVSAVLGVIITIFIAIFVRDYPSESKETIEKQHNELSNMGFLKTLKKVILNPQNVLSGLFIALTNVPVFLLGAMWGNLYLVQAHKLTSAQASIVSSVLFFGLIIGSPLAGFISDRCCRRRMPMIFGAILSFIVALAIVYIPTLSFAGLFLLFFLLGIVISSQIIGYPLIAESNTSSLTGTAIGLASIFILSMGFTQILFGWLLGFHWQHVLQNGEPIYAASDYSLAMLILPIGFFIALLAALLCKETYCVGKKE